MRGEGEKEPGEGGAGRERPSRRATSAELAADWGVTRQAVEKMLARQGAPKKADGTWDRAAATRFRKRELGEEAEGLGEGSLNDEKRRKIRLECQRLQLGIDETLRALIPADDHRRALLSISAIVRRGLEGLKKTVAAETRNTRLTVLVERSVDDCLRRMADEIEAADEAV